MIIKFLLKELFLDLPIIVISPIVSAIALIFTRPDDNRLPSIFEWFDNADHNGDGLFGDYHHIALYDGSSFLRPHYKTRRAKFMWLLRNPANYFTTFVLGDTYPYGPIKRLDYKVGTEGKVGNNDNAGRRFTVLADENNEPLMFEYYKVVNYGNGKCLRIRIGHDIGEIGATKPGERVKAVFVIHPYMTYRGSNL